MKFPLQMEPGHRRRFPDAASLYLLLTFALGLASGGAGAAAPDSTYYQFPADLTSSPFNCTNTSGINYSCPGFSMDKESVITLASSVTLDISGAFTAAKQFETVDNGYTLTMNVTGSAALQKDVKAKMNLNAGGSISIAKDAQFTGNITAGGSISIDKDGVFYGNVIAGGTLDVASGTAIYGNCSAAGGTNYTCLAPVSTLHHVRLNHSGSGLTCTPSTVTVHACNDLDSGGTCTPNTGGVAGNVVATGGPQQVSVAFTIPSGSSSVDVAVPVTSPVTATFSVSNLNKAASGTCWNGSSASCSHVYHDSGFLFDVPHHIADAQQSVNVTAVRKSDSSASCSPAFANVTRPVKFSCAYSNPVRGSSPVRVGGQAVSSVTCDGSSSDVNLDFNASGVAPITVQYADAGMITLSANYAAANMTGSDSFVAAPSRFVFSGTATAQLKKAGVAFSATVTAQNSNTTVPTATPNFGQETTPAAVVLSFSKCQPVTGAAGTFTGTLGGFSQGVASGNTLQWSEVGNGTLTATTTNYLGSGIDVTGTSGSGGATCVGAVGPFTPAYFLTSLPPVLGYAYSGQPIVSVRVTPYNGNGAMVYNYTTLIPGNTVNFAKKVTLSAYYDSAPGTRVAVPTTTGAMDPDTVAANAFSDMTVPGAYGSPAFTFKAVTAPAGVPPSPLQLIVRATDEDQITSAGQSEATINIRFGRLRMSSAYGSAKQTAKVPVQAQYWLKGAWLLNSNDNSTFIPAGSVALTATGIIGSTVSDSVRLSGGKATITLQNPNQGKGFVDLAINLGSGAADVSCLNGAHPASTPANLSWLRSLNGGCALTYDRDPSARASFGVFAPETKATVHVREVF